MAEVNHGDIQRIYDKMEKMTGKNEARIEELRTEFNHHIKHMNSSLQEMSISAAVMAERFGQLAVRVEDIDIPEPPDRPCPFFEEHMESHKSIVKPVITAFIITAFLFVQEPIKAFFAHIFKGP